MTDIRHGLDGMTAIHRGLNVQALAETPVALDDGVGGIDAIDDDGHPGAAGNDQDGTRFRPG